MKQDRAGPLGERCFENESPIPPGKGAPGLGTFSSGGGRWPGPSGPAGRRPEGKGPGPGPGR